MKMIKIPLDHRQQIQSTHATHINTSQMNYQYGGWYKSGTIGTNENIVDTTSDLSHPSSTEQRIQGVKTSSRSTRFEPHASLPNKYTSGPESIRNVEHLGNHSSKVRSDILSTTLGLPPTYTHYGRSWHNLHSSIRRCSYSKGMG